jgi:putative flippase GtrA
MKNIFELIGNFVTKIFDFFYPPFGKYLHMNIRLYRYAMSGSLNVVFGWVLYFFIYNILLKHNNLNLGIITLSSHIGTLAITSPITLLTGFLLQKYVTFTASELRGRVQLMRYLLVFVLNSLINITGLKILVDYYEFYPTPSQMVMTIVCIIISYISQHFFTFKTNGMNENQL